MTLGTTKWLSIIKHSNNKLLPRDKAAILSMGYILCPSPSHIATDGLSVSKSWCRAPSVTHDQIFITVEYYGFVFCGAPSLTRARVCLLYMLLVLASAVFLGSESLGTRDHILLSQIWDFPFCCLLRHARSRWRYSTPPPHGWLYDSMYLLI
jgi:hypothetical protein